MRKRMIWVLLQIMLASLTAHADTQLPSEEPLVIDIDTALELARVNNLSLQSQFIDLRIKERARKSVWNTILPSLGATAGISFPAPSGAPSSAGLSSSVLTAGLSLGLTVSTDLHYQVRNALLEYETGTISLEAAKKQLNRDVGKSFYNLLLMEEEIELIRANIVTARKRFDQAKTKYDKGLIPELDFLNTLMTLENLKPTLEDSSVAYETALMLFKELLGLERNTVIRLEGEIEVQEIYPGIEERIQSYLSGNLEIRTLIKNIQILENEKKLLRAGELWPEVSLSYSYSAQANTPLHENWASETSYSQGGSVALNVSIPLDGWLPGSRSRVEISDMEDTLRMAHLEFSQTLRETEDEIIVLLMNLEKSSRTISVLEQNVSLAQKTYDLTERQYNAGVTDLLSLEEAHDNLQESKHNLLSEKYSYQAALIELEYALNTSLRN